VSLVDNPPCLHNAKIFLYTVFLSFQTNEEKMKKAAMAAASLSLCLVSTAYVESPWFPCGDLSEVTNCGMLSVYPLS
jgi:hypothetical protein